METFLKREPKPCGDADCPGLGPGCGCDDIAYCESQGCGAGDCHAGNCVVSARKRMMNAFLKREPKPDPHCADCAGLFANCFCEDLDDCANYGCTDVGACTDGCACGDADCPGLGPGCGCDDIAYCESQGCGAGDCHAGNCVVSARKRMMNAFLKREPKQVTEMIMDGSIWSRGVLLERAPQATASSAVDYTKVPHWKQNRFSQPRSGSLNVGTRLTDSLG
ncbi:hypothetical protein OS493_030891 [Desmophyllum pertusum]|uniref:Uncharacterized protein n=1 Tax=Desmophyllum pertusum TaxID=174260 RepID=A0A9X0CEV4_9CNID|nr:hypothetical protein OS493_030891 [Desmophyllum pertusum]